MNLIDAAAVILGIERHRGVADRIAGFVQDLAADHGSGREAQDKSPGVDGGAGDDRGGELLVLIVGGGNESSLPAGERVLAEGNAWEIELAILLSYSRLKLLRVLRVSQSDAGTGESMAIGFADNGSCHSVAVGGNGLRRGCRRRGRIRLRREQTGAR